MPYIATCSLESIDSPRQGWNKTFDKFKPILEQIPQVQTGAVPIRQAAQWLELASRILPDTHVQQQLNRKFGLGAREIRALWAMENNEYYPGLGAVEVYSDKNMLTVEIPDANAIKSSFVNMVGSEIIQNKYSLDADRSILQKMSRADKTTHATNWMMSRPVFGGTSGGEIVLVDLKHNYSTDVTQSDELRMHYHALVAESRGINVKNIYQANIKTEDGALETLMAMSRLGGQHSSAALNGAIALEKTGGVFDMALTKITMSPDLFQQVSQIGNRHWNNVMQGHTPQFTKDQTSTLTPEQQQMYVEASKELTVINRLLKAVEGKETLAKAKLLDVVDELNISDNVALPYKGASTRKRDELDLEGLGTMLEKHLNVSPTLLRHKTYDMKSIDKDARQSAINVNNYATFGGYSKEKVLALAQEKGVDVEQFTARKMSIYNSGQSRGPIAQATTEIQEQASKMVEPIIDELIHSAAANSPSLYGQDERVEPTQSTRKTKSIGM